MKLHEKHCIPCKGGEPPLGTEEQQRLLEQLPEWGVVRNTIHRLERRFRFRSFRHAMSFVTRLADIAESEGHHPDIYIFFNRVHLSLHTHAVSGLTENDFILAAKIDRLFEELVGEMRRGRGGSLVG